MLKYENTKTVQVSDWDDLVQKTYGIRYRFQQQDGCQPRGVVNLSIPDEAYEEEEMNDSIPEVVNGDEMGVKFEVWLARDPKKPIPNQTADYELEIFYDRNFYPHLQTVANDLHKKGLIESGDYTININW